ncbi:tRNA (adenosine(37)-N6)-dimethylallyltransferase MiaA [Sphingobacterium sp. UT-1RO-CII-1]|uniref:tRNA (adenosine(37)-N6)-dimethylallyltransferase MiaA n=1 Tax=Sphingobacterium sp. UT-1RO-CII-1 TaxID=2995225 RepID=UPI00227A5698|nr:tRNA (adenosine(37)-N6)-dimethylallyltransferase MiaA [Sphingobacterium sp. UT-1RO-CII-1]MCY4781589.1 tRNA (adenosine(37)-N6)-dimethylallyltransferase MiaA [Sphingobacterium sp. UT-1RO-CII-1]
MLKKEKLLLVVVGPTAVGKTAMAIALAKHYKTEIISADSRQFYKEMNIGTAKPSEQELAEAKHHFIDSHSIAEVYSAGDFERDALVLLDKLFSSNEIVVMVGGSGLFVRALCEGLDDLPKAPAAIREHYNKLYEQKGLLFLQEKLKEIDPVYYTQTDIGNPQRIIRALEVFEVSGMPMSSFQKSNVDKRPFKVLTIGLNMDRAQLYDRINKRVDHMMEQGLLEEVKRLVQYRKQPALLTVGYAEFFDYLDGVLSLEEAIDKVKQNSRKYAKRQITWFKKYGNTIWFEPQNINDIIGFVDRSVK